MESIANRAYGKSPGDRACSILVADIDQAGEVPKIPCIRIWKIAPETLP
ncbi:MAG: hypothetical protein WC382_04650 [Methanoregulaceae archaeon]